jgi:protein-L-isoaspartate(D-aspartate) O-methyltransferase
VQCLFEKVIPDTFRFKGLRNRLVEELRVKKLYADTVLEAMKVVPRHQFFPDQAFADKAYEDIAFRIGAGQTISHPSTVAYQTTLLNLRKGEKVLEIGTGSGYQTAVLVQLGVKVFSVERQHSLFTATKRLLETMQLNAKLFFGDGYKGLPPFAPFDKILVTAGAPFIPDALIEQLKPGGRLVIPVGVDGKQEMHLVEKSMDGTLVTDVQGAFSFVPLLEDRN